MKRTLDLKKPPTLTAEQQARLARVAAMPDAAIDYSDAPFQSDAVWMKVIDLPRAKKQITLRIDEDVLDFFKQSGTRYQSRINAVLKAYKNSQQPAA